jgi:DNA-binding IclR family transcriptional regulator
MALESQGIQSLEIAFSIIDGFLEAGRPLGLSEAADRFDMPRSKLHKYLVSLVRLGVLRQGPDDTRYAIGPKLLESGFSILGSMDIVSVCEPELYSLRHSCDEAAALAVWMPKGPMIVRYLRSTHPVAMDMQVGFYAPVMTSAAGKCFAAHLPEQAYRHLVRNEIAKGADAGRFADEIKAAHKLGYSTRDTPNRLIPGSRAIASPVFFGTGIVAGTLLLIGFENGNLPFPDQRHVKRLQEAAQRVSQNLGYHR